MLYTYSVEPDRDFDYFTPCNNKYITYITLVTEIPSTPYLVYSSCHCCASDEISGHAKMLSCIHPWLHVQFSYKPVTGNAHFFRPCTFRHVRSVFMAILTFLTIIDYSWQQGIGFEHFIDSFYDRHRIFPLSKNTGKRRTLYYKMMAKYLHFPLPYSKCSFHHWCKWRTAEAQAQFA